MGTKRKVRASKRRVKAPKRVRVQPSVSVDRAEFVRRFRRRFLDPAFDASDAEVEALAAIAWDGYEQYRIAPRTKAAGRGFGDPTWRLSTEWLDTRKAVHAAERRQKDKRTKTRILIVNGSARSDQTCPGESSKTFRLAEHARRIVASLPRCEADLLDLSNLTSEVGRVIYPCKACVSTAQPLCHWPCTCYPNHALGQTGDWMGEIYPRWAAAHGVFVLSPVNWYQAPSVLKLMMDRLVCADGGNPDPTTTRGKDADAAKAMELKGWDFPKHLAGRAFAVFTHGDAAGAEGLRHILVDWLTDLELVPAGPAPAIDRYIGYYRAYATSHQDLDAERPVWDEVKNLALALVETARQIRSGRYVRPDRGLEPPREK
jgi:multimeric flavodoxin WrbA